MRPRITAETAATPSDDLLLRLIQAWPRLTATRQRMIEAIIETTAYGGGDHLAQNATAAIAGGVRAIELFRELAGRVPDQALAAGRP
jgi:hypothetical protein